MLFPAWLKSKPINPLRMAEPDRRPKVQASKVQVPGLGTPQAMAAGRARGLHRGCG
ncbi:hypothetical protein [Azospirillum largimobile]